MNVKSMIQICRYVWACTWVCLGLWAGPSISGYAQELDAGSVEYFEAKVRPLLVAHCYECHSEEAVKADNLQGGLRLDNRAGVQQGGESGPVIVAGKPEESALIRSVRYSDKTLQMPPSAPLSTEQVAILEKWVSLGAPDPREGSAHVPPSKAGIDFDEGRKRWAFQPPIKHPAPPVANTSWPIKTLDYFVLAALEQRSLKPVRPATRQELLRRASFDLIGLPPTPEECAAFEKDVEPGAWERVITRLLMSPHYGERWGRYWLDVARYADDQGNSFLTPTPAAYLYRDWVVKALNDDMPYDEFVRLQIAGDLLPDPASDYVTRLAGLGFQSLGPQFRKGAAGEAKAKADELEDRVDTLSRGILGLTVSCARCHDHKFDPIPTRDYYSLASAYNGADWPNRMLASPTVVDAHNQWRAQVDQSTANLKKWKEDRAKAVGRTALDKVDQYVLGALQIYLHRQLASPLDEAAFSQQQGLQLHFLHRWIKSIEAPGEDPIVRRLHDIAIMAKDAGLAGGSEILKSEVDAWKGTVLPTLEALRKIEQTTAPANGQPANDQPAVLPAESEKIINTLWKDAKSPFFVAETEVANLLAEPEKLELANLQSQLEQLTSNPAPSGPMMPSISGGGQAMKVFIRGNPEQLGELAPPGFLQILSSPNPEQASRSFSRLELANAIVSPDNPLTARVFVNRVWHYHFGRGIVATLSNFGKLGGTPTHPELLDTLATQFIESGWSIKALHREIMLSATYQLSSEQNADNLGIDPGNEYLWRMSPRRLDIEAWRDALLSVSGAMDPLIGGPSVDQATPGVKEVEGFNFFSRLNGFEADNPAGRRRTLYTVVSRYAPNATLTLFDFPEPNVTSDQRNVTTVPQQQLFVLNGPFILEMSREFAKRLEKAATNDPDRIRIGWQLAFSRPPSSEELTVATDFLNDSVDSSDRLSRWEQLAHAIFASNEFMFLP